MDRLHPRLPPLHTQGVTPSHARGAAFAILMIVLVQLCVAYGPVGWMTYILAVPALVVLILTAIAGLNDMGLEKVGPFWNVRRCGLILVAYFAVQFLALPLARVPEWPSWYRVAGVYGFAFVWITRADMPPWFTYIWKNLSHWQENQPHRRRKTDQL